MHRVEKCMPNKSMGLYGELTTASSFHQWQQRQLYTSPSKINSCQLCVRGYCSDMV